MTTALATDLDPYSISLEDLDVSDPVLFEQDVVGAYFKRLREEDPVHYCRNSRYEPYWSITKYSDIVSVDSNHRVFSSEGSILLDDARMGGYGDDAVAINSFIAMDPPKHDEQRKSVTPAVAPANLARMENTIRERTQRLLDSLPVGEVFDWVPRVSIELTTLTLATLMDFPLEDREKLLFWSEMVSGEPGDGIVESWEHRNDALRDCAGYFLKLREERSGNHGGTDLISMMANAESTRDMSPIDYVANVVLLMLGGHDTTRNSMSGGVLALHDNPDQFAKLVANPALIESLVPEIVRWQTPVTYMARRATEDTVLRGKTIRKGDKVVMWYLSGNRDEEAIEQADRFIIDRARPRQHLSFGFGIHRCVGNRLAELQLRVLWEEILVRFQRIEVVGPAIRLRSNVQRAITSLPVILHA